MEPGEYASSAPTPTVAPQPPRLAAEIFGDRLPMARRYANLLVSTGIEHGLVGPREAPKVWDRHIVNCAIMESLLPHRARVIDVGSGAGLPGIALAIARPDVHITLLEPLARRTTWLENAVADIGLPHVSVRRGRAEDMAGLIQAPFITARAVAKLSRLVGWAWPLTPIGGRLLALKGQSAEDELAGAVSVMAPFGIHSASVISLGEDLLSSPVRVIQVIRGEAPTKAASSSSVRRVQSHRTRPRR